MSSKCPKILILGGGVAGLTTAMALTKFAPTGLTPRIEIYEIRPEPGTVGGAVNLTPNALRLLDFLDVLPIIRERNYGVEVNAVEVFSIYHPHKLAESSFRGPDNAGFGNPPYKALRITRASLMEALVQAITQTPNIAFHCGKRATHIIESPTSIQITFSDTTLATGDLLLGCDGVHSFTRNAYVEPSRTQLYTGVANAFGFVPLPANQPVHFDASALNFSRRGMLLTSYHEPTLTSGYVGAVLATPDAGSRDGWKTRGADSDAVRADIRARFQDAAHHPAVHAFIEGARDWYMWPVYMLPAGGRWARGRTMLVGDAAHGMPPQGEGTGIVLEDGVLLARCLWHAHAQTQTQGQTQDGITGLVAIKAAFAAYERLRRARIDQAFKESQGVVSSVKDVGYLGHTVKTWVIPVYLWWSRKGREKHFSEDVTTSPLGFGEVEEARPTESASLVGSLRRSMMGVDVWKLGESVVSCVRAMVFAKRHTD